MKERRGGERGMHYKRADKRADGVDGECYGGGSRRTSRAWQPPSAVEEEGSK